MARLSGSFILYNEKQRAKRRITQSYKYTRTVPYRRKIRELRRARKDIL